MIDQTSVPTTGVTEGQIRFESDTNMVAAKSAAGVLEACQTAFDELGSKLAGNKQAVMKIRPFTKGSLIISFVIEVSPLEYLLFEDDDAELFLRKLIDAFRSYVRLKLFLEGRAPQEIATRGEAAFIEGPGGDTIAVDANSFALLDRSKFNTDSRFAVAFSNLAQDKYVKGIQVSTAIDGPILEVAEDRYDYFSKAEVVTTSERQTRDVQKKEVLRILTLSFDPELKWRFIRSDGSRITAKISDEQFWDRLADAREEFSNGDDLHVVLSFQQSRDAEDTLWHEVATSYTILKVDEHRRAGRQREF